MTDEDSAYRPKISIAGRQFNLPGSRLARIVIGVLFLIGGVFGILPILGFWMVPVGLLILSVDLPVARRWRRRLEVWWGRRRQLRAEKRAAASARRPGN